jgi:hypothetical protein
LSERNEAQSFAGRTSELSTPVENGTHHRLKTEHGAGAEP